jgi:hypothetical protein
MRKIGRILMFSICSLLVLNTCEKPRLNFDRVIFPREPQNMFEVNSIYDDYNSTLLETFSRQYMEIIFSTNRISLGDDYDLVQFYCEFSMDLIDGDFGFHASGPYDHVWNFDLNEINSEFDELGPYVLFETVKEPRYNPETQTDVLATVETHRRIFYANDPDGHLDINCSYYHRYHLDGIILADHVTLNNINSAFDDAYPTIKKDSAEAETMYFTSNRDGDFDIFSAVGNDHDFINLATSVSISKVQRLSSEADDKCPYIGNDLMVFTSNRDGGYGGFDLYYSVFSGDDWSEPVNLGPHINTEFDEYRPVIITLMDDRDDVQDLLIFSSDRPGGMGGYDLYYAGIHIQ